MRSVLQRVRRAHVTVGDETVGQIGLGLLVLLGVGHDDDVAEAQRLAKRVATLRLFDDEDGRMNHSLIDVAGGMLVVSQFTLWGELSSGRRPSWSRAAPSQEAEPIYRGFVEAARELGLGVAEGRFGAAMEVHLTNLGPVTLILD